MGDGYMWLALVVLLTVVGGLPRIFKGPTRADSMLAAMLYGTASVAILILLGMSEDRAYLLDVALVFSLLSALAVVAFVTLAWHRPKERDSNK